MDTTKLTEVIWSDPPPSCRGSGRVASYAHLLDALRENPGKWGVIEKNRKGGVPSSLKKKGFQGVTRKVDGEVLMFARYVGVNGQS